jgi:hypothetical protein
MSPLRSLLLSFGSTKDEIFIVAVRRFRRFALKYSPQLSIICASSMLVPSMAIKIKRIQTVYISELPSSLAASSFWFPDRSVCACLNADAKLLHGCQPLEEEGESNGSSRVPSRAIDSGGVGGAGVSLPEQLLFV